MKKSKQPTNPILRKKINIQKKINHWYFKLRILQIDCPHNNLDVKKDNNWTEFYCPDCGKHWYREDPI